MEKINSEDELSALKRRVEELESRINEFRNEEKQWEKRELHIMELIRDREDEIRLLKSLLHRLKTNDQK